MTDTKADPQPAAPITTEQLDQLQFGRSLHERPAQGKPWPAAVPEGEPFEVDGSAWDRLPPAPLARALQLAAEYDAGTAKCMASGYMEFGPEFLSDRKLVSDALRHYAGAVPQERVDRAAVIEGGPEDDWDGRNDLATMLRRFIWMVNKEVGDSSLKALAGKAQQLLAKHGMEGSPLREGHRALSNAKGKS
jgi:hypothetical protein